MTSAVLHMRGLPTLSRDSYSYTVWTIPPSHLVAMGFIHP
jgi:hypothetical protein